MQGQVAHTYACLKISLVLSIALFGITSLLAKPGHNAKPKKQECSSSQAKSKSLKHEKKETNNKATSKKSNDYDLKESDIENMLHILKKETVILAHTFKLKDIDLEDNNIEILKSQCTSHMIEQLHLIKTAIAIIKESNNEPAFKYASKVNPILNKLLGAAKSKKSSALEHCSKKVCCSLIQIRKLLDLLVEKVESECMQTEESIEESIEEAIEESVEDEITDLDDTIQSRLDIIEEILEECCFSLESKLDNLSIGAACDLSGTFTVLNTIESTVDSCCASILADTAFIQDQVEEVIDQNSEILGQVNLIAPEVVTINSKLDDCCFSLESKLDILTTVECEPTPIFGPTTITADGTYCLAADVIQTTTYAPAIEIASNSVVLDLNGHIVGSTFSVGVGIQVDSGVSNVVIKNGTVQGGPGTAYGISFVGGASSSNYRLEKLFINSWAQGIYVIDVYRLVIDDVISSNNTGSGILLNGSSSIDIRNSLFNFNYYGAYLNAPCKAVHFEGCHFDGNSEHGFFIQESCDCVEIINCFASGLSTSSGSGFEIDFSTNVLLKNNFACSYAIGFNMAGVTAVSLLNNTAEGNLSDGFIMQDFGGPTTATLRDNASNNNGGYGFDDTIGNINQYYNNTACKNTSGNYNNVTSAPVTSPAAARGADNIDCTNTDEPIDIQTLSKLDDCCFSLNSKVDGLTSCCSAVQSQLDACCFSIQSKLDMLMPV